jgi:hypothetical protein
MKIMRVLRKWHLAIVVFIMLSSLLVGSVPVFADNTVATYPGTASTEDVSPEDDYDWTDANNIRADDGDYAVCTFPSGWYGTYYSA